MPLPTKIVGDNHSKFPDELEALEALESPDELDVSDMNLVFKSIFNLCKKTNKSIIIF